MSAVVEKGDKAFLARPTDDDRLLIKQKKGHGGIILITERT